MSIFTYSIKKKLLVSCSGNLTDKHITLAGGGGSRLTFVKATYNSSKSSWHAERSNLSMSVNYTDKEGKKMCNNTVEKKGRGKKGIDKNFALDGQM